MSRKENIGFSVLLLVASGLGFLYSASQIKPTNLPIHHMLFPAIILGCITALSLIRLILALRSPKHEGEKAIIALKIAPKSLITMGLIGLYAFCCRPLGFVVTTFLYLTIQMLVLWPKGRKNCWLILIISTVCAVGLYYIFSRFLNVMLPTGILYFI